MIRLGAFEKKCIVHIKNQITHICTAEGCDDRVVCQDCLLAHNKTHSKFIKPIIEILGEPEMKKLDKDLKRCSTTLANSSNDKVIKKLESAFKEIAQYVQKMLDDCYASILSDIEKSFINFDILGSLKEEVLSISDENFKMNPLDQSSNDAVVKFAARYSRLVNEIKKAEKKISCKYSFSVIEVQKYLNTFKESTLVFRDRIVQNLNRELQAPIGDLNVDDFNYSASGTSNPINSLVCIPEREVIIAGDSMGKISVIESNYFTKVFCEKQVHKKAINSVKYREMKNYIFTGSDDLNIGVFQLNDDNTLREVELIGDHQKPIVDMTMIESKNLLISVGEKEPNPFVYDMGSLTLKSRFNTQNVNSTGNVCYIATRELVAVSLEDSTVNLYELDKFTLSYKLNVGETALIHSLNYIPNLDCLIAGAKVKSNNILTGNTITFNAFVWEFKTNSDKPTKLTVPGEIESVYSVRDSTNLLVFGKKGAISYIEAKTKNVKSRSIAKSFAGCIHDVNTNRLIMSDPSQKALYSISY